MPVVSDVLCAIDFSPASEHAARFAVDLVRGTGARLRFAHVVALPAPSLPMPELGFAPQEVLIPPDRLVSDAREGLLRFAHDLCVDADIHVVVGSAASEIVRLAEELGTHMIVMGTHGRTGLAHLLLGSVAERVIRHVHVPVLVVPAHHRAH